jgi:CDP-glycerol glycerophosphotransferase (TagB/SpsB family)
VTGHPKLEAYNRHEKIQGDKRTIIYAPHHSFDFSWLNFATFHWNGVEILNFAKEHPEFNFIFKPHQGFRKRVVKYGVFTEEQAKNYYEEWEKIGTVYDKGDYFDLFVNSDCLITDCGSFLAEYLPTKQPVIHLINENSFEHSPALKKASSNYYKVKNLEEMNEAFQKVLVQEEDPLREARLKDLEDLNLVTNATENIITYLKEVLNK